MSVLQLAPMSGQEGGVGSWSISEDILIDLSNET